MKSSFDQACRTSIVTRSLQMQAVTAARPFTRTNLLIVSVLAVTLFAPRAHAADTILHNFAGPGGDGNTSYDTLVADKFGNLYGTTWGGGTANLGTIFVLCAPGTTQPVPCAGFPTWTEFVLYSFQGVAVGDGANPASTLIFGGNYAGRALTLYGTTYDGGAGGGTVFELCAPAADGGCGGAFWTENVLHRFKGGKDGLNPFAGVIKDKADNLYGTTVFGGGAGFCNGPYGVNVFCGTVFKLKRPAGFGPPWPEAILHRFGAPGDGEMPYGALCCSSNGAISALYGTTFSGGPAASPQGTVFKLKNATPYPYVWVYGFSGPDGEQPYDNVILDSAGNVYGTAYSGGGAGGGVIFKLTQPPPAFAAPLYNFCSVAGCADGANPAAGLELVGGKLYGTTYYGGVPVGGCGGSGCGTAFVFTLPAGPLGAMNDFVGAPGDGSNPWGGVTLDPAVPGFWYGTTSTGGTIGGNGVAYSIP